MIWLYNYEYDCTIRIRISTPLHVASLDQATIRRGGMLSWIGLFPLLYVYSLWQLFAKEIWWLHQLCGMAAPFTTCYICYAPIPNRWPVSKPVSPFRSRLTGFEAGRVWIARVEKIEGVSWSALEVLARCTVAPLTMQIVDPNSKFAVSGTPLRISSTVGLIYLYFSRRWTSPSFEAIGSPRRRLFVHRMKALC